MKKLISALMGLAAIVLTGNVWANTQTSFIQNLTGGAVKTFPSSNQKKYPTVQGWANYRVCGKTELIQFSPVVVGRMKVAINNPTSESSALEAVCNYQAGKVRSLMNACAQARVQPGPTGKMMLEVSGQVNMVHSGTATMNHTGQVNHNHVHSGTTYRVKDIGPNQVLSNIAGQPLYNMGRSDGVWMDGKLVDWAKDTTNAYIGYRGKKKIADAMNRPRKVYHQYPNPPVQPPVQPPVNPPVQPPVIVDNYGGPNGGFTPVPTVDPGTGGTTCSDGNCGLPAIQTGGIHPAPTTDNYAAPDMGVGSDFVAVPTYDPGTGGSMNTGLPAIDTGSWNGNYQSTGGDAHVVYEPVADNPSQFGGVDF